jgi:hypothetical protein
MHACEKLLARTNIPLRACLGNGGLKWMEEYWMGFWEILSYNGNSSTPMPFIPLHSTNSQTSPQKEQEGADGGEKKLLHAGRRRPIDERAQLIAWIFRSNWRRVARVLRNKGNLVSRGATVPGRRHASQFIHGKPWRSLGSSSESYCERRACSIRTALAQSAGDCNSFILTK